MGSPGPQKVNRYGLEFKLKAVAMSNEPGFSARAAQSASAANLDPKHFKQASTHWMRHTFVREALVDGTPIEVVRDLVGHASIDTTSIYSTQELARKIRAVHRMKRRLAPTE